MFIKFFNKFIRLKESELEAKLRPVSGGAINGRGKVEVNRWKDGSVSFEAAVRAVELPDASTLGIWAAGEPVCSISIRGGYGRKEVSSLPGDFISALKEGDSIEARSGDEVVFQGKLMRD